MKGTATVKTASSRFVIITVRTRAKINRSFRMNARPALRSAMYPSDDSSSWAGRSLEGIANATIPAETANVSASIQRTPAAPKTAIRSPLIGAPISRAPRSTTWIAALARSIGTWPSFAISGISAARAVPPGSVEQGAEEDEREQEREGKQVQRVQPGDHRDGQTAGQVRDDAGALVAEAVDDRAAEEAGDDDRRDREEGGDAGLGGAAGGDEHEPRDREVGQIVANKRDRVGRIKRVQRRPVPQLPGISHSESFLSYVSLMRCPPRATNPGNLSARPRPNSYNNADRSTRMLGIVPPWFRGGTPAARRWNGRRQPMATSPSTSLSACRIPGQQCDREAFFGAAGSAVDLDLECLVGG